MAGCVVHQARTLATSSQHTFHIHFPFHRCAGIFQAFALLAETYISPDFNSHRTAVGDWKCSQHCGGMQGLFFSLKFEQILRQLCKPQNRQVVFDGTLSFSIGQDTGPGVSGCILRRLRPLKIRHALPQLLFSASALVHLFRGGMTRCRTRVP